MLCCVLHARYIVCSLGVVYMHIHVHVWLHMNDKCLPTPAVFLDGHVYVGNGVSKLLMIDETPRTRTSSLEYLFRIHNRAIKFYSRGLVSVNITAVLLRKCNTPILKMVMVRKVLSHISNFENLLRNVPPTSDRARRHMGPSSMRSTNYAQA